MGKRFALARGAIHAFYVPPMCALVGALAKGNPYGVLGGLDDGASEGTSSSQLVTADSATTITLTNGARLTIPAGAADAELDVTVERLLDSEALEIIQVLSELRARCRRRHASRRDGV